VSAVDLDRGALPRERADPRIDVGSARAAQRARHGARCAVRLEAFGELAPISRLGGQGRVYRPTITPRVLGPAPVVIKLYRRSPPVSAARVLAEMVTWTRSLEADQRTRLEHLAAWPVAVVSADGQPVGIAMQDVSGRFAVPFVMPSGRREHVLLALEHLLGADSYLESRGLGVRLDTITRIEVAERVSAALAFLHRHAIVASDIAPNNLLVSFGARGAAVCFIDCDSMVFRGRQALAAVETGDWEMPGGFAEPALTRAADAYKLGLVVLRLFARSHEARAVAPHLEHVPAQLRPLLGRALAPDTANRPPAGEWQRALSQLLADARLNERYPGPAAAAVPRAAPVSARPGAHLTRSRSTTTRRSAASVAPRRAASPEGLRRTVAVLWIVAGTAVLFLLLSRMFASAIPTQDIGPGGAGGGRPYLYQYYNPSGSTGGGTPLNSSPGTPLGAGQGTQFP
jgi:hypothetical protein